jgi:hypothetical protein
MSMSGMYLKPEERKASVRGQLAEAARILAALSERHDLSDEAFEMELRMQATWLCVSANQWHEAARETAQILRMREVYLKREGPAQ